MRVSREALSISGWNWVTHRCLPRRHIWNGQAVPVTSSRASCGRALSASLCPTKAENSSGTPASSGSARPAAVTVSVAAAVFSAKAPSTVPPANRPSVPTP